MNPTNQENTPLPKEGWERAAMMYGDGELTPEQQRAKAKAEADIAEDKAKQAEAEARQREARGRGPDSATKPQLSPAEHGQVVSGLVQKLIEGGVDASRAYTLALQALNPSTPAAATGGQPSSLEAHMVTTYFDDLHAEVKGWREAAQAAATRPPAAGSTPSTEDKRDPAEKALDIFTRYREMGEAYMRSIGINPEDPNPGGHTPEGANVLTSLGANLDAQLKVMEFMNEQKLKWAAWEKEQKRLDREAERTARRQEERHQSVTGVLGAIEKNIGTAASGIDRLIAEKEGGESGTKAPAGKKGDGTVIWECPTCHEQTRVKRGTESIKCPSCDTIVEVQQ